MIDVSLLATLDALNALTPLYASSFSQTFANPEALASQAQASLSEQRQFPSQQVLALSGLFSQSVALNAAAAPLILSPAANGFLVNANSPVLPAPPYTQTVASSSNAAAVNATSQAGATLTSYQIGVSQIGVAQVNTGTALTSANPAAGFTTGNNTLRITMNGGAYVDVPYTIYSGFTNEQALTAVQSAINSVTADNSFQRVTLSNATSGNFTLTFNGQTTAQIAVGSSGAATALNIQTALGNLPGVGVGNVNVSTIDGSTFTVGFHKAGLNGEPLPLMTATNVNLNASATVATAPLPGFSAAVTDSGGNSTLSVTSNGVGTSNAFTLSDVTGNAVAQAGIGIGSAGTAAQDAVYTINGVTNTSTLSNTVSLDNGKLSVSLLADTSTPATVTVAANNPTLANTVTNLADAFNNLQSFLNTNAQLLSPSVSQQAQDLIRSKASMLSTLGITTNSEGTLAVNQTVLQSIASSSPTTIQSALSGPQGLATALSDLSSNVLTSLDKYFAGPAPQPIDQTQLTNGLAQNFGNLLMGEQLFTGNVVNLHG